MRYIIEYNPAWPQRYQQIERVLLGRLFEGCQVHHVGSTSVPDMPSKDIIDVVIECPVGSMPAVIQSLASLGYEHEGDKGIHGREAFRPMQDCLPARLPPHHLYACEQRALELRKHLAFRDFLIAKRDRRIWLAEQKRLVDHMARTREEYIQNKSQAYVTITAESLEWAAK